MTTSTFRPRPDLFVPLKAFPKPPPETDPKLAEYLEQITKHMQTNDLATQNHINEPDPAVTISGGDYALVANAWTPLGNFVTTPGVGDSGYHDSGVANSAIFQGFGTFVLPISGRWIVSLAGFFDISNFPAPPIQEAYGIRVTATDDGGNTPSIKLPYNYDGSWSDQPELSYVREVNATTVNSVLTPEGFYTDHGLTGIAATFTTVKFSAFYVGKATTYVQ